LSIIYLAFSIGYIYFEDFAPLPITVLIGVGFPLIFFYLLREIRTKIFRLTIEKNQIWIKPILHLKKNYSIELNDNIRIHQTHIDVEAYPYVCCVLIIYDNDQIVLRIKEVYYENFEEIKQRLIQIQGEIEYQKTNSNERLKTPTSSQ